ncbi:type-F conjugative transfer system protein TraW [Legionella gresilensis]|uniref:type-F conjugative transfer system protein TraW n=1 Tax=Legionella gresilensis TaxID=91823 RepID=UPI001F5E59CA|nr:type-F conjugative transfer system protein TraW [Legionella gresilensis]
MRIFILSIILSGNVAAKSFGVVGEVFPVAEKSFLMLIEERLNALALSGELETIKTRWIQTVIAHTNRPNALKLLRTTKTLKHDFIPEIILNQDIADSAGRLLFGKGVRINALERMHHYKPCWLFFNADDKAQINWAESQKNQCLNPKFILTGGEVHDTEIRLHAPIYFDQGGSITKKLNIASVPAMVNRVGNKLVIVEQAIKENGDVL